MITGKYRFADKIVEINSLYETVHAYCRDYSSDSMPDIIVTSSPEDIEYEKSRSDIKTYSEGYYEELAVYRKICEKLPYYDTLLFHGSVISVDGAGYAFTAPSGTGKSTHAALWRKLLGDRAVMVNDDKPLLHIGEQVTAYGTPYNGKHHLSNPVAVPLKAVCILERDSVNSIEPAEPAGVYPLILQQTYRPLDVEALRRTMVLLDKMMGEVKFYRLRCNMDIEAAEVAYKRMSDDCKL